MSVKKLIYMAGVLLCCLLCFPLGTYSRESIPVTWVMADTCLPSAAVDTLAEDVAVAYSSVWAEADAVARTVPAASAHDCHQLAGWLKRHLVKSKDRVRAIYSWIARNIVYDVYPAYVPQHENRSEEEELQAVLDGRKGTCLQYTLLFEHLCRECGIDAYVVRGYNKRDKALLPDPHQWCVAQVEGTWYLFDPTWGAGRVEQYRFTPAFDEHYFMVSPDSLWDSHMPFDPLWQMREHPRTYEEFDRGMLPESPAPYFAWRDTLAAYSRQSYRERLEGAFARMQSLGKVNQLVNNELQLMASNINVLNLQEFINVYNQAMKLQSVAVDSINKFIRYRKAAFQPLLPDEAILRMVEVPDSLIKCSNQLVNSLQSIPAKYRGHMEDLRNAIVDISTRIYKELRFVQTYVDTPRRKRKNFFPR